MVNSLDAYSDMRYHDEHKARDYSKVISKWFSFLFVCYPLLAVYSVGALNLGQLAMIPFVLLYLAQSINKPIIAEPEVARELPMMLCIFVLSLFVLSFLSSLLNPTISSIARLGKVVLLVYGLLLILAAGRYLDPDISMKVLKGVLIFVCSVLVLQHLANLLLGIQFQPYFPFLDTVSMEQTERILLYQYDGVTVYRPSSVFVEPSHFGLFCGLGLSFLLFLSPRPLSRSNLFIALFVTGSMLMSTSGVSIVFAAACWLMYLLPEIVKRPILVLSILVAAVAILLFSLSGSNVISMGISRIVSPDGSWDERMLSFLPYLDSANPAVKLIGCGIGSMSVAYDANMPFLSGIGILLLESGMIGFLCFVALMLYLIMVDQFALTPFCILIVMISLVEQYFYGTFFAFSVAIPLYCYRRR